MSDAGDVDTTKRDPQQILNEFWDNLISKKPGKVTSIFPQSLYANLLPPAREKGPATCKNAAESYEAAAEECRKKVRRIVRECQRTNEKYTDPDFDIESDFGEGNCLKGLLSYDDDATTYPPVDTVDLKNALNTLITSQLFGTPVVEMNVTKLSNILNEDLRKSSPSPAAVHRIEYIFENPQFVIDGYSTTDVKQGGNGDCWWVAAVATLCNVEKLMDKICVDRDEECGVYGFVFHRDGEWFSTVVDDNLYLHSADFDKDFDYYDASGEQERKYKKYRQTGSDALYFAKCADQNETWLPLLEKAYAKAHGDYKAISGGVSGEAVEDMTGGVTTSLMTNKILSKERLWQELLQANKKFIFAASSSSALGSDSDSRRGLAMNHAYSVLKAVEEEDENGKKFRLVLIRNPWGSRSLDGIGEWNGPWSDGSKEWTPYWLKKLNHKFGDDGMFWMSYDDLRKRFSMIDRTRLFDHEWTVVQKWTSVSVSWVSGYLNTKFQVEIKKEGPVVFVLSQLDDRYFRGLEGQYEFELHFLLQEKGAPIGEHIVRARGPWSGNRSVSAEVDLPPGCYEVLPKIGADRDDNRQEVQEVVKEWAKKNPQKLRQIGLNYDIANAKGIVELTEGEKAAKEKKEKEEKEKKAKAAKRKKEKEKAKKEKDEKKKRSKRMKGKGEEGKSKDEAKDEASDEEGEKEKVPDKTDNLAKKMKDVKLEDRGKEDGDDSDEDEDESDERKTPEEDEEDTDEDSENDESEEEGDDKKESTKKSTKKKDSSKRKRGTSDTAPSAGAGPEAEADAETGAEAQEEADADANADGGGDAAPQPAADPPPEEKTVSAWNAVCVIGLRVYSKDPEVTVRLMKPKDLEEGGLLDQDGTEAGATM